MGGVAVLTVQAKQTGVQDGFSVAFYALSRRAGENFVYMASIAINLRVATFQEKHPGMVELVHTVGPIVAILAKAAELVNVFGHEGGSRLALRMAVQADSLVENSKILLVAVAAREWKIIPVPLVAGKAKTGRSSVVKRVAIQEGWSPACWRVARLAFRGESTDVDRRLGVTGSACIRGVRKGVVLGWNRVGQAGCQSIGAR